MLESVTWSKTKKAANLLGVIKQLNTVPSQAPDSSGGPGQIPGAPQASRRGASRRPPLPFHDIRAEGVGSLTWGLKTSGSFSRDLGICYA